MPIVDTVDSIEIQAPAQALFDIILDYPRIHEWYSRYQAEVIGGGAVAEGARIRHEISPPRSPVKTRFTRTIQRIEPGKEIEESYDEGDLVGQGRWVFESVDSTTSRVSFYCKVRSNNLLMHIGFALGGEMGHHMVYEELLAALKLRAEAG
jgi:hypothetical protein